ncbi:MAG: type II toxin-antitoxin system HicA family toxin [Nitrososphaera sp.]
MSKLPVISSLELIKYLSKKGYRHVHTSGSHHILVCPKNNKRISVPERDELGKGLLRAILAECGIEPDVFIREWNG